MRPHARKPRPHNPMPESPSEVLALFTGAMVGSSLAIMSTGALMPFFAIALHAGQTQLGIILSVQMLGSVAVTSVAGMLTDRYGDKAVVQWSGLLMGAALIASSLVANYPWLVAWLAVYGIGFAAVTPAGSHAIIFFFKKEDRGFAMGVRQCGIPIAGVVGSVLLPAIAAHTSYRPALASAGVLTLAACIIASQFYREPKELQGERISLRAMLLEMIRIARDARLILLTVASMILVCSQLALMGFLTLTLVHRAGYPLVVAVAVFTLSQIAAVAGRLSWGAVSDRIFHGSRALPLAIICVMTSATAFSLGTIGPHTPEWLAAMLAIIFGFTAEGWLGLSVIGFAEIGGEEHAGSALGAGLTATFAAGLATPTLFGALVEAHGYPFAWHSVGILELAGIIPALLATAAIARSVPTA